MELPKVAPPVVSTGRTAAKALSDRESATADVILPTADHADIRPLDVSGALQILLAEVRASLDSSLLAAMPLSPGTEDPAQAARGLLELLLRALPDDALPVSRWTEALARVEAQFQSGIERGIGIVSHWRDAGPEVVDAVLQVRLQFASALNDDLNNPLWLRPKWIGLAPLLRRFHRRRRMARRLLADPDYSTGGLQVDDEFDRPQ